LPNREKREKIKKIRGFVELNAYGYRACELVYTKCGDWLEQLLAQIAHNRAVVQSFFEKNLPEIRIYELQGTYLLWMDFRALGKTPKELEQFMHDAGWYCDEGYIFGTGGEGFERLNLACPTWVLEQALERLHAAIRGGKSE
jgi:aminotransferase/cystathionine beta-lyase